MSVAQRCQVCSRKISLLESITATCRCKEIFCSMHRIEHKCTFDYKEDYKNNNKLVKCVSDKIAEKI